MNPNRNELELTLGQEKILLRPTFENVAAMEQAIGGLAYLGWKFSKGFQTLKTGETTDGGPMIKGFDPKNMPTLTEIAQVIYYNQVATKKDDPTLKKFSLEEIWDLVKMEGIKILPVVTVFITRITAGDKTAVTLDEMSPSEKKS
jgi:hypothetical protein